MSRAGRPERPLHTTIGPLAELADELRRLRSPRTYRELAAATGLSIATLRTAAAGERLPTWKVTRAFTSACSGDESPVRKLWENACAAAGHPIPCDYLPGDPPVPGPGEVTSPEQLVAMMNRLRMWAGNPSLAELNERSGGFLLPPSTVSDMLRRHRLPRPALLSAFVRACGLDDNKANAWEQTLADLRENELNAHPKPLTADQLTELQRQQTAQETTSTGPEKASLSHPKARPAAPPSDGQLCALFAVDIAGFTEPRRDDDIRWYLHMELYRMLEWAFDSSGIPWARCFHEDRGDGALVVVPPDIASKGIIDPLLERLRGLIRRHNHVSSQAAGIQIRAAAHIGPVEHDGHGFIGGDINLLFRLLEARPLKHALTGSGADLALIVSDDVYRNLICRYPSLVSPDAFQRVRFQIKNSRGRAWVHLPGEIRLQPPAGLRRGPQLYAHAGTAWLAHFLLVVSYLRPQIARAIRSCAPPASGPPGGSAT